MQVQVLVTVDVDDDDAQLLFGSKFGSKKERMQAAAVEAVRDAVKHGEQVGFCHELADDVSVGVVEVELYTGPEL